MNLYDAQDHVLNFFKDYSAMIHNARFDATHGKGLKMLTPEQMLQRLPIALAQVKIVNTYI